MSDPVCQHEVIARLICWESGEAFVTYQCVHCQAWERDASGRPLVSLHLRPRWNRLLHGPRHVYDLHRLGVGWRAAMRIAWAVVTFTPAPDWFTSTYPPRHMSGEWHQ